MPLVRFLLPNACIVCGRMVERSAPDDVVCSVCRSRMKAVANGCGRCAQPYPPVGPCRVCAEWPAGIEVRSAVWLDEEARAVVHSLKYRGFRSLGGVAAARIATALRLKPDAIMPIPLGPGRLRRRGYNQSAYIARALGDLWDVPVCEDALIRVRETRSQTELTPDERSANVTDAFEASWSAERVGVLLGRAACHVALVDDVFTTGATLVSAAERLLEAGWKRVSGVTFARARTFAGVVEVEN
jgi:ComF family protein